MKLRHTVSQTIFAVQESLRVMAQACSQWHLRILLIQLEQAEETKGEMQQAEYGRGATSPCSSSLSSSSLAVFNRCLFLPSWPGGEALGSNGELMEEMWNSTDMLSQGSPEDWLLLWAGGDVSTGEGKTALVSGCATCHPHFDTFTVFM